MPERYWLETLGCPKNQVDSDKLAGPCAATATSRPTSPERRRPRGGQHLRLHRGGPPGVDRHRPRPRRRHAGPGARLVVTGCMAERYGDELAAALPEVDLVAGFGVPVTLGRRSQAPSPTTAAAEPRPAPSFDLLNLPRPAALRPWAYVKVAEGCDRRCGFCAIPSFRGQQRSRPEDVVLAEVDELGDAASREVVLVAQDLASWGLDRSAPEPGGPSGRHGPPHRRPRPPAVAERVERVRLLYLYPSALDDALIDAVVATGVPYFDLSLQHVSRPLVQRMRRWGDGETFLDRIDTIRAAAPDAALRSSFILGYPGETEEDHDLLLVVPGRGPARLGGLLHLLRGARHLRRRARPARCRPSSPWSACASARSSRTPSPPSAGPSSSVTARGPRRRARHGPVPPRGPRDRRRRPCPTSPRGGRVPQGGGDGRGRAGSVGRVVTERL